MKIYFYHYLFFLILLICGCGTLGSFKAFNFSVNKQELSLAIDTIYKNYPYYKIPEKWKKFDTWEERGYDFLDSRIFYFKDSPEEMYYVTFRGEKANPSIDPIDIAIRAVSNGKGRWLMQDDFSKKEIERIESRLESEILLKTKHTYFKSD